MRSVEDEHWRWRRLHFLDPDVVVRQQDALGRLELRADESKLRERVQRRRDLFLRYRAGRPRVEYHAEWAARFVELRDCYERRAYADVRAEDDERAPSDWQLYVTVARDDFAEHSERWSYDPATAPRAAADHVRKALEPLLTARN